MNDSPQQTNTNRGYDSSNSKRQKKIDDKANTTSLTGSFRSNRQQDQDIQLNLGGNDNDGQDNFFNQLLVSDKAFARNQRVSCTACKLVFNNADAYRDHLPECSAGGGDPEAVDICNYNLQ